MHYVVSDIHNDYQKFCELLKMIEFSKDDKLFILGDLFDRSDYNPNPVDLYFKVMELGDNCSMIRGNHDEWLAAYILKYYQMPEWKRRKTEPYQYNTFRCLTRRLVEVDIQNLARQILTWPLQLSVQVNNEKYLLAHAMTSKPECAENKYYYLIGKLCMEKGLQRDKASLHMVFTGNPGTAKTTVARLFAEIMKDEKILSTGVFVEEGRADLVGEHVGATAPLVKKKFKEAQGGVLFIDEAYSLCDGYDNGFGDEAINTIVQEMENHRDDVIVIFAGYPEPMQQFLDRNPGMRSRIAFSVEFNDYSVEELCEITKLMLSRKQMTITEAGMKKLKKNFESVKDSRDYGNGRFARKMLEEAEMNLAERICQMDETEITIEVLTTLEESDIPEIPMETKRQLKKIGFAC